MLAYVSGLFNVQMGPTVSVPNYRFLRGDERVASLAQMGSHHEGLSRGRDTPRRASSRPGETRLVPRRTAVETLVVGNALCSLFNQQICMII